MLTRTKLQNMQAHKIFDHGYTEIDHPWYGQSPEYPKTIEVKWIAIRGGIEDWAIYTSFGLLGYGKVGHPQDELTTIALRRIADHGMKLHDMEKVQQLVPCNDEALKLYRH